MSNIQKAFKTKAKRGLCMAAGGFADNYDLIQNPTAINERAAGFSSMDHDPMADMNSLTPTPSASAANPFYDGRFGNDPHFAASTSREIQAANLGKPRGIAAPAAPALPQRPIQNMLTPVDQLFPSRRGLQMAAGGVVAETPEQVMARMAAKYGVSATPAAAPNPPVTPAPAPAPQPAQPSGGLFQGAVRSLRDRAAQIDKVAGYAEGGMVVADGGRSKAPTADSVPVNLSHGEAVLPVKTVAALGGPAAVETLIETTNGKPTATRGLRAGGRYAEGSPGWWDKARGAVSDAMSASAEKVRPTAPAAPAQAAPDVSVVEATPEEFARAQNAKMRAGINAAANGSSGSSTNAPRGTPFEVNGPLSADGRAAATRARTLANTNLRPATTVVEQLAEGAKDVGRSIAKVGPKVMAVANNPLVRNAGYTATALSAVEPVIETVQDKNQIRFKHENFSDAPLSAAATRAGEVLSNTVDMGAKFVDNMAGATRVPMNWAVEALGGPKNYFRDRALSNALHSAVGAPPNAESGPSAGAAPATPARAKPVVLPTEPIGDAPMVSPPIPPTSATAQPPVAQGNLDALRAMGGGAPVRTLRGAGTQIIEGRDASGRKIFVGGHERSDAENEKLRQAEAERMKGVLAKQLDYFERAGIEGDLKSSNEFYQQRGLARQKAYDENSRTEAARDLQRQELDIRREDLGLRRAQEQRAMAGAQFDREQKILETQRKATEDMDKDEKQAYDAYLPMFTAKGKDAQGNTIDIEDKAAHAAFINAVRHTMAQRNIMNPTAGKPISFGSLPKTEQDRMYQRFGAVQRLKRTMGNFPWNADKADSPNLDDFDAVQNPDGTLSFPALEARMKGRSIKARTKDFTYADGPSTWYDPFQTPDNSTLQALLSRRTK